MGMFSLRESHIFGGRSRPEVISTLNRADYLRAAVLEGCAAIVLVEDNPADVLLLREVLASNQIKSCLFVAPDGDEAIRFIDEIDTTQMPCPHLVILDLNLPRKSGFEVLAHVRSSEKCQQTPVVILSSSEAAKDREQATRLGASSYIRKPSTLKDLTSIGEKLKAILAGATD
jgi:CheY-like chemotaxis protein